MSERVVRFGENRSLVGVVCDPVGGAAKQDVTALLLINSGLVHRVGPNRLYVNAARRLASAGFLTMRFDLSGVGDSEPRTDSLPFEERSTIEIRQAMDLLETTGGIRKFILTGICSGADNAFDVASADPRVVGVIPIDLYSVPSTGYLLHSYRSRALQWRSWGRLLTGRSELWSAIKEKLGKTLATQGNGRSSWMTGGSSFASAKKCIEQFRLLARRGTHLCLIFSGESPSHYNYRILFHDELQSTNFEGKFQAVYFDAADHGFTMIQQQEQLIQKIDKCVRDFAQSGRTPQET